MFIVILKDVCYTSLSFVDLENTKTEAAKPVNDAEKEWLVLFLEKSYTATINDLMMTEIDRLFVRLVEKKTEKIEGMLV